MIFSEILKKKGPIKLYFLVFLIFSVSLDFLCGENESQTTAPQAEVSLTYRYLQPGEALKIILKSEVPLNQAQISFLGERYPAGKVKETLEYLAIVGFDLDLKPGDYPLDVLVLYADGRHERIRREIRIISKEFPLKKLQVKEKFVTPPPEVQERIQRESEILKAVYDIFTMQWLGKGEFIVPSEGEAVPNFGERRIFNGKPRSPHSGVDISSPYGALVKASNSGNVVLASDLYFSGKTVILNHGLGVFTLYCHFSKISVQRGESVNKGGVIGEVGATGRVTGPHLHWAARVTGSRVDPFSLLSLKMD